MNSDVIDFIYRQYNEKVGQEGKAREQILISLFNQGWIRLRRYKQFWSVNVRRLDRKTKQFLQKWASKLLQGRLPWKDFEGPYADVKIDQPGSKPLSSNLKAIAQSPEFVAEGKDHKMKIVYSLDELEDLPLYPFAKNIMEMKDLFEGMVGAEAELKLMTALMKKDPQKYLKKHKKYLISKLGADLYKKAIERLKKL